MALKATIHKAGLGGLCQRSMRLQARIQDGHVWFSDGIAQSPSR